MECNEKCIPVIARVKDMNILWITLESILPANTGGRIGVFKRLEQLAKTEKIYLFYPYDNDYELLHVNELRKYCQKVYPYSRRANKKHGLLKLWKYPFTVGSREFPSMKRNIQECIKKEHIDVINVDFPHMCVDLLDLNLQIPIVLNEHNIEWKVYRTIARSHKNIFKKAAYFLDSYRLEMFEKMLFQKLAFSKVTFVSSKDMQYMIDQDIVQVVKAELIPVGADVHEMNYIPHNGRNIIFVGKMSYGPNVEAVKWFADEVFPQIKAEIKDVRFYIVGKDPVDEVKALQSDDVIVTGMVDDVKEYYSLADLVVLPLKNGGGVKVKLLEAISFNKPIVSTTVGVEGTYYASNLIPISDESQGFSKLCKEMILEKEKYPTKEVFEYYENNYTWIGIGRKYRNCLEQIVNGG